MGFFKFMMMAVLSLVLVVSLIFLGVQISLSPLLEVSYYDAVLSKSGMYGSLASVLSSSPLVLIKIDDSSLSKDQAFRKVTLSLISNTLDYVKGYSAFLDLSVDVDAEMIKDHYVDDLDNLTVCNDKQVVYDSSGNLYCRPQNVSSDELLVSQLEKKGLSSLLTSSKYNLARTFDKDDNLGKLKPYVNYFVISRMMLIIIIIFFMFIIVLSYLDYIEVGLRMISFSFILVSLLLVVAYFIISPLLDTLSLGNDFSSLIPSAQNLPNIIFFPLLNNLLFYALGLAIIGVFVVIISFFVKTKIVKSSRKDSKGSSLKVA